MSNQTPQPNQTFEPHPPVPPMPIYVPNPKRPKKRFLVPILIIAALLFGVATGAASTSAKEVEVIKEVEVVKEVPVEKIVTETVEVTPKSCTDALDYASILFTLNADAIGTMQNMLKHAVAFDAAGLDADTAELNKTTEAVGKLKTPFTNAVKECRAG